MKIIFTGGGTGGHFYPLIAVARALKKEAEAENIARLELFFVSDEILDKDLLFREDIKFIKVPAGKIRRYFSLRYIPDTLKTLWGILWVFWRLYLIMPDMVFSKGGYASFPTLVAARFLKIPVLIHDSDAVPGLVSRWTGEWTARIAVSFMEAARYFEGKNVAITGNPIRPEVVGGNLQEAIEYFRLEENLPTILILGGSQGSERINEALLSALEKTVKTYQIIHQTGKTNFEDVASRAEVLLEHSEFKTRYHPHGFLGEGELRGAYKAASIVIARAGSGLIFEIAANGAPAILIPLPSAAQNHQRENAYAYARFGACEVIEETNLTPNLLLAEIDKILANPERIRKMKLAAAGFARPDAAQKIAREIIKLGIHE